MSNSSLVNHVRRSPNYSGRNGKRIDRITIHHMAGNLSVESCGNVFAPSSRQASSNYGIDSAGRIGLYVDEGNRSWCSSSRANDERAVTIEVADNKIGNGWGSSVEAMSKLVLLCADICRRNGIHRLIYTGNTNGNLTLHKWFASTDCPGAYLESQMPKIAEEVNKLLSSGEKAYVWGVGEKKEEVTCVNATIQGNSGEDCMRLELKDAGDGYFYIKDKAHGLYLDVSGAASKDGTNVQFYKGNKSDAQKWKLIWKDFKNAKYLMLSPKCAPDKYLSVENNGAGGKNNLKLWGDLHNQKQKFYVREEADGYTLLIHTFSGKCVSAKN